LFYIFTNASFQSQTVTGSAYGFRLKEKLRASVISHRISRRFKSGVLGAGGYCSLIVHRRFTFRHCWATRALCIEPHASRWFCHSTWEQSCSLR